MNQIINASSTHMIDVADESVHLVVTSPPYNVNKEYEKDAPFSEWLSLMRSVFTDVHRVLIDGGRICINVANTGRNPYRPLHYYVISIMLELGFLMRGEIIWNKATSAGTSTAWGSWCSATNPSLRDVHEYILIFSKDGMKRVRTGNDTIARDEFLEYTKSIWSFPTASAKRIGHPAPFPLELPRRLIQLYSFEGDAVLDPFCGSGTTCVAAVKLGRQYIGYDIVPEYCDLARRRVVEAELATDTSPLSDERNCAGTVGEYELTQVAS